MEKQKAKTVDMINVGFAYADPQFIQHVGVAVFVASGDDSWHFHLPDDLAHKVAVDILSHSLALHQTRENVDAAKEEISKRIADLLELSEPPSSPSR